MPYIQFDEKRFPLSTGEVTVGTGPEARIRVPAGSESAPGVQAIVQIAAGGGATIRRISDSAVVSVNGVPLRGEPSPLIHGDKIEVGGEELLYGDDLKGGSTQYMVGLRVEGANSAAHPESPATAATGGRLVSLVDGRDYSIPDGGLVIGRDPECDVVVPGSDVSRRHAAIAPGRAGYTLTDTSANGVSVNGERIRQSRRLGRGDILRIGTEEFRFHADAAATGASPGGLASSAVASSRTGASSTAASARVAPSHTAPSARIAASGSSPTVPEPPASTGPVLLATLEILNEGVLKGRRFDLTSPLVHIGRGPHNEIAIADESVSDSHAKLQKRATGWHVVDLGSTNGTYVSGQRISSEQAISGSTDLRFGGVKMAFRAAAATADTGKSTRVIAGASARQARQLGSPPPAVGPVAPPPGSSPEATGRLPLWLLLAAVLLVAAAIIFFIQGRS